MSHSLISLPLTIRDSLWRLVGRFLGLAILCLCLYVGLAHAPVAVEVGRGAVWRRLREVGNLKSLNILLLQKHIRSVVCDAALIYF